MLRYVDPILARNRIKYVSKISGDRSSKSIMTNFLVLNGGASKEFDVVS